MVENSSNVLTDHIISGILCLQNFRDLTVVTSLGGHEIPAQHIKNEDRRSIQEVVIGWASLQYQNVVVTNGIVYLVDEIVVRDESKFLYTRDSLKSTMVQCAVSRQFLRKNTQTMEQLVPRKF